MASSHEQGQFGKGLTWELSNPDGSVKEIYVGYHATNSEKAVEGILNGTFRHSGHECMLGSGIYFSKDPNKCL